MKSEEFEAYLEISKAIASTRDRKSLLKAIFEKIQPLFKFHDIGLFVIDFDNDAHVDLTTEMPEISPSVNNYFHFQNNLKYISHAGSVIDHMLNVISKNDGSFLFDFKDLVAKFPNYPQFRHGLSDKYRDCLAVSLRVHDETIGMFCMNSLQKDFFKKEQFDLLHAIADQLANVVNNVVINERLESEKRFKEALLGISQAISGIQHRRKLIETVFRHVRDVFPFDDFGIMVFTDNNRNSVDLAVEYGFSPIDAVSEVIFSHDGVNKFVDEGPLIMTLDKLEKDFPGHPHYAAMSKIGLKQVIGGPMIKGNEPFGMLCFWSKEDDFYSERYFPLFNALTDQLAVAVNNVLANEKLIEEKLFSKTLLGISEAVATIQDRKELFSVIFNRIKPVFSFDEFGVFVLNKSGTQHYELTDDSTLENLPTQKSTEDSFGKNAHFDHKGTSVDWLMTHGPIQLSLSKIDTLAPHPQHKFMLAGGLKHVIGGPLKQGGKVFGMLNFTSKKVDQYSDEDLPLFQAISDQLAVAVTNVLANEQLIEEKKFKETLLSIGQAISGIQDRNQLIETILTYIKDVFHFDDLGIMVYVDHDKSCVDLAVQYEISLTIPDHKKQLLPPDEGVNHFIRNGPMISTLDNLIKTYPDHPHYPKLEKHGHKQVIGGPLKKGNEAFGMLCFWSKQKDFYSEKDFPLFQAICNQLAVTVDNVLANEALKQSELEEVLKVQLIDAFNTHGTWSKKLTEVAKVLQPYFPFELVSFTLAKPSPSSPNLFVERVGSDEYRVIGHEQLLSMTRISKQDLEAQLKKDTKYAPIILSADQLTEGSTANELTKAFHQYFNVRNLLVYPLALGNEQYIKVAFYAKQEDVFTNDHKALFGRLAPSLSLTIDRQINYFETLRLNELIAQENEYLQEEIKLHYNFGEIVGSSENIREIFYKIQQVANTDSSVLISGETGTGKELVARAIHDYSHRKSKKMVKLNCATLPAELLESELFGHEKGAFTGALNRRIGKFELADKGTIFLDEIGEMPLESQSKLLRVIQEREFERLGGNQVIKTDVRIMAATNRNLEEEIANGNFRKDLFYRLNVFPIHLPPLRDRKEDIMELAQHFIKKYNKRVGRNIRKVNERSIKQLNNYHWPGNVRELEHVIERAMITAKGATLDIRIERSSKPKGREMNQAEAINPKTYREGEIQLIMNTLKLTGGKISGKGGAAEMLDLHPATLESKMRKLGIKRQHVVK